MRQANKNYIVWTQSAEDDLRLAKIILKEEDFYPAVCFHCQQCVEKTLKAYLLYENFKDDFRTHFLENLVKLCAKYDNQFLDYLADSKILDRYYFPTRYPDAYAGITVDGIFSINEAKEAISIADRIYKFVMDKIK